jgi:hypothetical protein
MVRPRVPLLIFLICGLIASSPPHAQNQPQKPLAEKNILILHALEPMMPVFEKTED